MVISMTLNLILLIGSLFGGHVVRQNTVFTQTYYAKDFGFPFSVHIPPSIGEVVMVIKFPITDYFYLPNSFIWNFFFWIAVVFIVLSLVRHFKKKAQSISAEQGS